MNDDELDKVPTEDLFQALARRHLCVVLLTLHEGKNTENKDGVYAAGSARACRAMVEVAAKNLANGRWKL